MSNDELAQSLPWRENEGWNPTFSLSQMGKASLLVFCHGEKRCMKWPIRWGVVNPVSSHVKSQCRTVLATSNAITCLWHCGMRHRGGRTVIQARRQSLTGHHSCLVVLLFVRVSSEFWKDTCAETWENNICDIAKQKRWYCKTKALILQIVTSQFFCLAAKSEKAIIYF